MKKSKFFIVVWAQIITLVVIFSGQVFAEPVSKEKSNEVAQSFIKSHNEQKKQAKLKQLVPLITKKDSSQYSIQSTNEIKDTEGKILAYVHTLDPEGFVITSADDKIRPVLGYSFNGKFPLKDSKDNVWLHLIYGDVPERMKVLESDCKSAKEKVDKNKELWAYASDDIDLSMNDIVDTLDVDVTYPPASYGYEGWIKTKWRQSGLIPNTSPSHYHNELCPIDPETGYRSLVGCTATAMSQIINYWEYPQYVEFKQGILNDDYNDKILLKEFPFFENSSCWF